MKFWEDDLYITLVKELSSCQNFDWSWMLKENIIESPQSVNGHVVLANSSLATAAGPGLEISLVTLRNLLAKGLEDY